MKLQSLRPNNLKEFVGKQTLKQNLKTYLKASSIHNEPLDHCLFYGLPGTGKTSLAFIIAKEQKANIKIIQGSTIQKNLDVYNFALTIHENDVVFIDEIHGINKACFELLYSLMEDFSMDITIGKDFNSRTTRIKVPKFTLIGATTSLTKIPKPLEERFGIQFYFEDYSLDEIKIIISNAIKKVNVKLTEDEILAIATNSKGIPRNALTILSRVIDFKTLDQNANIKQIFKQIGIFANGLNKNDMKYLMCFINSNGTIGIKTLSQMTDFEIQFIEEKIEPYLFKNKYVIKTTHGRKILSQGLAIINKIRSI
ncbi:MAG: Holliday junction branch migration DNA helicase RuvB [Mycoplasmoidaceae bacterium]|nr:Holliday junction branch migration DNA helicase RuvB [Mycoplasmoidaceae bacterium]